MNGVSAGERPRAVARRRRRGATTVRRAGSNTLHILLRRADDGRGESLVGLDQVKYAVKYASLHLSKSIR